MDERLVLETGAGQRGLLRRDKVCVALVGEEEIEGPQMADHSGVREVLYLQMADLRRSCSFVV